MFGQETVLCGGMGVPFKCQIRQLCDRVLFLGSQISDVAENCDSWDPRANIITLELIQQRRGEDEVKFGG